MAWRARTSHRRRLPAVGICAAAAAAALVAAFVGVAQAGAEGTAGAAALDTVDEISTNYGDDAGTSVWLPTVNWDRHSFDAGLVMGGAGACDDDAGVPDVASAPGSGLAVAGAVDDGLDVGAGSVLDADGVPGGSSGTSRIGRGGLPMCSGCAQAPGKRKSAAIRTALCLRIHPRFLGVLAGRAGPGSAPGRDRHGTLASGAICVRRRSTNPMPSRRTRLPCERCQCGHACLAPSPSRRHD